MEKENIMNNKEIIKRVYDEVFNGHKLAAVADFFKEDYIQHSPGIATGREGFIRMEPDGWCQVKLVSITVKNNELNYSN